MCNRRSIIRTWLRVRLTSSLVLAALVPISVPAIAQTYTATQLQALPAEARGISASALFDSTPPAIAPTISGTLGTNAWYTSNVTVNWTVNDPSVQPISQTGCGAKIIRSDTRGQTLRCSSSGQGDAWER